MLRTSRARKGHQGKAGGSSVAKRIGSRRCAVPAAIIALVIIWSAASRSGRHPTAAHLTGGPNAVPGYAYFANHSISNLHIVVSTSCSPFQRWQMLSLVHSHKRWRYPGRITEVVGCNDTAWRPLERTYKPYQTLVTPDFQARDYSPRQKPLSLAWVLANRPDVIRDNELVVIMDPDQIIVGPWPDLDVYKGHPAAAGYGQGSGWMEQLTPEMCPGHPDACDITKVTDRSALAIGAPYVLHADDFRALVPVWADIMESMLANKGQERLGWIVEMHAYTVASLATGLPHRRLGVMISNARDGGEPWHLASSRGAEPPAAVAHYCQALAIGDYKWGKHEFHDSDLLHCSLQPDQFQFRLLGPGNYSRLEEDLARRTNLEKVPQDNEDGERSLVELRQFWLYKHVVPQINEALQEYHVQHCPAKSR